MTTITVNIDNEKAEKALKSVIEALGLEYEIETDQEDKAMFMAMKEGRKYGRASDEEKNAFLDSLKS